MPSLEQLRAFALHRSIFKPTTLERAVERMGFVQADPIRAPARAQDLILRHRVRNYRAGDLERRYPKLNIEEDILPNYGFVPREVLRLMHPRRDITLRIERDAPGLMERVLDFVRENGQTHPRDLDVHFGRTRVRNYWGGGSNAGTRALEGLHYKGAIRVARRDGGIKVFEVHHHLERLLQTPLEPFDQARELVRLMVNVYAPLSEASLRFVIRSMGYGAPQLKSELRAAMKTVDLERAVVDGVQYLWPGDERPENTVRDEVHLLAPFDPVVWDRARFEHLHGWPYRFEAYTPAPKRKLGYYALPLLWRGQAIGWANLKIVGDALETDIGYVSKPPRERAFKQLLEAELEAMRAFLGLA